eukprot:2875808-Rhodomonas_salina.2
MTKPTTTTEDLNAHERARASSHRAVDRVFEAGCGGVSVRVRAAAIRRRPRRSSGDGRHFVSSNVEPSHVACTSVKSHRQAISASGALDVGTKASDSWIHQTLFRPRSLKISTECGKGTTDLK